MLGCPEGSCVGTECYACGEADCVAGDCGDVMLGLAFGDCLGALVLGVLTGVCACAADCEYGLMADDVVQGNLCAALRVVDSGMIAVCGLLLGELA